MEKLTGNKISVTGNLDMLIVLKRRNPKDRRKMQMVCLTVEELLGKLPVVFFQDRLFENE